MRILVLAVLLAGCQPALNVMIPENRDRIEFKMPDWPCTAAFERVEKETEETPALYAVAMTCQDEYDFRRMEKLGELVDLSPEEVHEFVQEEEVIYIFTRSQIDRLLKEWVREGAGTPPIYLGL